MLLLLAILAGQVPPTLTYAQALERHQVTQVPLVVLISLPGCEPCQQIKSAAERAGWTNSTRLAFAAVDATSHVGEQLRVGGTMPQMVSFVIDSSGRQWRRRLDAQELTGGTSPPALMTLAQIERALLGPLARGKGARLPAAREREMRLGLVDRVSATATRGPVVTARRPPSVQLRSNVGSGLTRPEVQESRVRRFVAPLSAPKIGASSWLSVNGSDPGAVHQVQVSGEAALVEPNTEQAWREHVAWHGHTSAWSMTPQQLAQAHADAHPAQAVRQPIFRRRR